MFKIFTKERLILLTHKIVFFIISYLAISNSWATNYDATKVVPSSGPKCRTTPAKPPHLNKFKGLRWEGIEVVPGGMGGFIVRSELVMEKVDLDRSREMNHNVAMQFIGKQHAAFFGHDLVMDLVGFPTAVEANARFDLFNSLIGNDKSHPAYMHYRYQNSNKLVSQKEYATDLFDNRLFPAASNGHLFYHDINAHFMFNWIPPDMIKLVRAQWKFLELLDSHLELNAPELLKLKFEVKVPDSSSPNKDKYVKMNLIEALRYEYLEQFDFGSGNFSLFLAREVINSEYGFHEVAAETGQNIPDRDSHIEAINRAVRGLRQLTGSFATPIARPMNILKAEYNYRKYQTELERLDLEIKALAENTSFPKSSGISWANKTFKKEPAKAQIWRQLRLRYKAIDQILTQYFESKKDLR